MVDELMSELLPAMDFLPHVITSHYSDFGEDQSCDPLRFDLFCNLDIFASDDGALCRFHHDA
jgi:hypothetical protein